MKYVNIDAIIAKKSGGDRNMAKIFTMTIFTKPDRALEWAPEPSITGRVIMCDDMRIFGYAEEHSRLKNRPAKTFYIDGTVTRHGVNNKDGFKLGFYCLGDGFKKHAYFVPMTTFTSLADGSYGIAETSERDDSVHIIRTGCIRMDFREYKENKDVLMPSEKDLRGITAKYEQLSGLPAYNETLLSHVNYWRKAVIA